MFKNGKLGCCVEMFDDELQALIDAGKKQVGINDVLKLHQDHMDHASRNVAVLRTRYNKGVLLTTDSTSMLGGGSILQEIKDAP